MQDLRTVDGCANDASRLWHEIPKQLSVLFWTMHNNADDIPGSRAVDQPQHGAPDYAETEQHDA